VSALLERPASEPAQRLPAVVQRTVWQKNLFTSALQPVQDGPTTHAVPPDVLDRVLQPGDRYDEATGIVFRLSGQQVHISSLLSALAPQAQPGQQVTGGFATPHLLGLHSGQQPLGLLSPAENTRKHSKPIKSTAANVASMAERRKERAKEATSQARGSHAQAARHEESPGAVEAPAMAARLDERGLPQVAFVAGDEVHHVFAGQDRGAWRLMIASIPLPVADFILEMDARFTHLKAKSEDTKSRVLKKMPRMGKTITDFAAAKAAAQHHLGTANATFANVLATVADKLRDEEALAKSLHRLITMVNALARRLGAFVDTPGNARKPKPADYYLRKMAGALERYRIEGLVARYQEQPDYPDSDFERDHQPHNDLIETMASLPEFAGKKMVQVAAGRTLLGWSIMLHHDRHSLGRTYGAKGQQVTQQFQVALAAHRAKMPTPTAAETRKFCIDYLVQSLKDDVAAMKAVANHDGNYGDLVAPVTERVNKAAKGGLPPSAALITQAVDDKRNEVKQQILAGEDRLLATESEVLTYDQ
jgi:hypothetical protein